MLKLLKQRSKAPSTDENQEASDHTITNKKTTNDELAIKNSSSDVSANKKSQNIDSTNMKSSSEDKKSIMSDKEQSNLIPKKENDELKDKETKCFQNSSEDSVDQPLVIKEEDSDCLGSLPDYEEIIRPQTVHVVKKETINDDLNNDSLIADNKLVIEKVEEEPIRVSDIIEKYKKSCFQLNSELLVYKVDSQCNKIGDNINTNAVNEYDDEKVRGGEEVKISGSNDMIRLADLTKLVASATEKAAASLTATPSLAAPAPISCNSIEDVDSEMVSLEDTDDEQSPNCFQSSGGVSSHLMMMAMNGRESGADRKRRKPVPLNTLCPICKNPAPGHSHFGGMCCYSCRAFFRRTSTRPLESFKCRGGENNCEVTAGSKCCIRCRLRKCLQSGMDPALIKGRRVGRRSSQYQDDTSNHQLPMNSHDLSMSHPRSPVAVISPFKENSRPTNTSVIRSIGSSIIHKTLSSAGRLLEERLKQPPMAPAPGFDVHTSTAEKQPHQMPRGIAYSILNQPSQQEYSKSEYLRHIANSYNTGNQPHTSQYHYLESRSPPLRPQVLESPKECYSNMTPHMPHLMPIHPPTPPSSLPATEDSFADDMDCGVGDDKPLDLSAPTYSIQPLKHITPDRPAEQLKVDVIQGGNLLNRQDYINYMEMKKREQYYRDKLAKDYIRHYGDKDRHSYSDRRHQGGHEPHPNHNQTSNESHTQKMGLPRLFFKAK